MSEAVDSFNSKIDEIKEDREKFEILMDEFFESKDINIKELLAEMMLHVIMTRGEELQIKFKELEDRRSLYGDWNITMPTMAQTVTTFPSWTYTTTNNTDWLIGGNGGSSAYINVGEDGGPITLSNSINITSSSTQSAFSSLDIQNIVEDIDLDNDLKINTKLFEDAVYAMSTWSSSTIK